ncbi:hypothetical protein OPV22_020850 [Ensete ventricosum]|uniref:PCI domain-containing protein n=1 Tax=Ensete ventricosum TaxID=4639 RepID=A0AAV8QJV5_ENSVE|nr:hypothetical protein OPV22_020850 [Ensete ventricosum]
MVNQADDIAGIISFKAGLQYVGSDLDAVQAVAYAHSKTVTEVLRDYRAQLEEDPIVRGDWICCRDDGVAIGEEAISDDHVEKKLSQMILDKKFGGPLDQSAGCLIVFDDPKPDVIFPATRETLESFSLLWFKDMLKPELVIREHRRLLPIWSRTLVGNILSQL